MSRKQTPDIMADLMAERSCPIEPEYEQPDRTQQKKEAVKKTIPAQQSEPKKVTQEKKVSDQWTRATFIVNKDLNEKIKAIAYWDRLTVKEVLHDALMQYTQGRNVKPVPKRKSSLV